MIAKISSTENLGGALGYNFKKVEKEEASILLAQGLYQNKEGTYTMAEVLADMQALIPAKCRTKKTVFHCSLNPHPKEKLSDETLTQIAKEYMEALGYGKQPYIVFKHNDIAREHIHIVSLRVNDKGQKINDKFEGRRSKKITDTLERKYGLIPANAVLSSDDEIGRKVDIGNGDIRKQIGTLVKAVLKHYRFCSLGEMNAILARNNLAVEEVKTEYRGKRYDGLVYVPTSESGEKVATPIKASDIGRGVGYTAVHHQMIKSRKELKAYLPKIRNRVLSVMRTSPKTEAELIKRLDENGLRTLLHKTENGRIYWITFVDDTLGVAVNGSRLGKGYSAAVFNGYFSQEGTNPFLDKQKYGALSDMDSHKKEQRQDVPDQKEEANFSAVEELIDELLQAPQGNDDWKEAAWQRKLRRKNKIRLGKRRQ
ncbi:conjugal transfer protein MobB [Hoylesella timonensis 4401737 = DSM 22865 = JCM 15640]|uniref:conjugal transfer protein MobB n=1 Tax=Hoylesella timonensis TaxID=386414 RepID=UPI0003FB1917|nr:conjugal transfer protein MobB [Hoylesella timonensis]